MIQTAVILASHGYFAREAMGAVEMIMGTQGNVGTLFLTENKSLDAFIAEANELCDHLDTSAGLLVLVDMYGGTPCNAASNLLLTRQGSFPMELLSGFSLPMLLEVFADREMTPAEIKEHIKEIYPMLLQDLGEILNKESGDDDADQLG